MKLILTFIFFAFTASAEIPRIDAWKVSCGELKNFVQNYKKVDVRDKEWPFKVTKRVYSTPEGCGSYRAARSTSKTKDAKRCFMGYTCHDDSVDWTVSCRTVDC